MRAGVWRFVFYTRVVMLRNAHATENGNSKVKKKKKREIRFYNINSRCPGIIFDSNPKWNRRVHNLVRRAARGLASGATRVQILESLNGYESFTMSALTQSRGAIVAFCQYLNSTVIIFAIPSFFFFF